jgi:hypothetical protein
MEEDRPRVGWVTIATNLAISGKEKRRSGVIAFQNAGPEPSNGRGRRGRERRRRLIPQEFEFAVCEGEWLPDAPIPDDARRARPPRRFFGEGLGRINPLPRSRRRVTIFSTLSGFDLVEVGKTRYSVCTLSYAHAAHGSDRRR